MKKWHKRILYIGLMAALLYAAWFYYTQPHFWKELDPAKPGFDVTKFRFEDYPELEDLKYVIETIIPFGTDIDNAKKILRAEPYSESYVQGPYCIDNLSSRYTLSAQIYSPLKIFSNHYHKKKIQFTTFEDKIDGGYLLSFFPHQGIYLYNKKYRSINCGPN